MIKLKKMAISAMLCIAVVSAGTTAAYFLHNRNTGSGLTIGQNSIEINEDFLPGKKMTAGDNVYQDNVSVKNTGNIPCYIRIYAEFSDSTVEARSSLSVNGSDFISAKEYKDHLPDGWTYISSDEDDVLGGYYYWTSPVEPGAKTGELFKEVKTTFETADDVKNYEIILYGESVQIKDKEGAEFTGDDAWRQAWAEFLERRVA